MEASFEIFIESQVNLRELLKIDIECFETGSYKLIIQDMNYQSIENEISLLSFFCSYKYLHSDSSFSSSSKYLHSGSSHSNLPVNMGNMTAVVPSPTML